MKKNNDSNFPMLNEFENLQNEINRLFNFSYPKWLDGETSVFSGTWLPAIDVVDDKDNLMIKADLPGLKKEDLDISLQDDILTIKGEKKNENEKKEKNYYRVERSYGIFQRSLRLPSQVDSKKVNAKFKDGVLELTLPKKEEAKSKQIDINIE